jgi:tetratricopeptide (TPR) repeat protein
MSCQPAPSPAGRPSGASQRALALYARGLRGFQQFSGDPVALMDQAIADSPAFVLAHAARAYMLLIGTDPGPRRAVEAALPSICRLPASAAEGGHVEAVIRLVDGEWRAAARILEDLSVADPHDILALQTGHLIDLMVGDTRMLRDRIGRALPFWSSDQPGYSAILGMHAFGLEETGDYARAEAAGKAAIELDPRDSWAQHAVAHVCEMQGRAEDGLAWMMADPDRWARDNFFKVHNWWHTALFHVELEAYDAALALYDGPIYGERSQLAYDMVDASALLWRLMLRGIDVGDRWEALADAWEKTAEATEFAFNDAHAMMAFAGAQRPHAAQRLRSVQARAHETRGDYSQCVREVGRSVCEGLLAFAEGRHQQAIELLRRVRNIANRFGGSHAQRDLIDLTLIEAAIRAGETALALALSAERLDARPGLASAGRLVRRAAAATVRSNQIAAE